MTSSLDTSSSGCPIRAGKGKKISTAESCPISPTNKPLPYNPDTNDFKYDQSVDSSQKESLSTTRKVSSIPKVEGSPLPGHQPEGVDKWVYPSEQQYYNAMKRKGFNPEVSDVPVILAIHNVVNEQGWSKVIEWESLRDNPNPKLVRFTGRPNDLSPKAMFLAALGYSLPFDRHDWVVERKGQEVRYVIDFYRGRRPDPGNGIAIHLDVRPAIDSLGAVVDRVSTFLRKKFWPSTLPRSVFGIDESKGILESNRPKK